MTDVPKTCYKDIHFKTCLRNIFPNWTQILDCIFDITDFRKTWSGEGNAYYSKDSKDFGNTRARSWFIYTMCDVHVPHISHPSVDQGIKDKLPPCIDQPTAAEQQEDLEVDLGALIAGTGTSESLSDQPCRTKVSPAEGAELMRFLGLRVSENLRSVQVFQC